MTRRAVAMRGSSATGMKSMTSPTPFDDMNRVISTAVCGKYICRIRTSSASAWMRKKPPFSRSSSDANMVGESNRGAQNQSMEPPVETSATVCRSPIRPWSAMSGNASMPVTSRPVMRRRTPTAAC